ncbi:MAG: electron transfer flavoprotein subunit beta/FixA family protein [Actinomycetota bacterium]|nr:electron transfer flavoprotein subunit beta/FixA family protein [Actinomycetota bacterium]
MNIAVCVKHVPDPNLPMEMDGTRLKRAGVQGVLDPGDEFGVEAALQIKEGHGAEVTLVSMGPESSAEALRRGLSMGADRAILVSDEALEGADALVTARVLRRAIERAEPDLVIAAVESTDGYTGTMPAALAQLMGWPQVTFATQVEITDRTLRAQRQTATGYHVVECELPALVTVTAGINEPRYASFKGIMAAKKKPLERLALADLGLPADAARPAQEIVELSETEERRSGEVIVDEGDAASRVAAFLHEAKVI